MRVAVATGLAALALASPAHAHPAKGEPRMQAIAAQAFDVSHCEPHGGVIVDSSHASDAALGKGILGWATIGGCRMGITNIAHKLSWKKRCTVFVHEYGHLSGLGHSTDSTSVMHPTSTRAWPGCVRKRRNA